MLFPERSVAVSVAENVLVPSSPEIDPVRRVGDPVRRIVQVCELVMPEKLTVAPERYGSVKVIPVRVAPVGFGMIEPVEEMTGPVMSTTSAAKVKGVPGELAVQVT